MRESLVKRKHPYKYSIKRALFSLFLLFSIGLLLGTVFYSIPTIYAYLSKKGYISPLSAALPVRDALGNSISEDMVKQEIQKANFSVKTIDEFDESFVVFLKDGEKIIFSKKRPLDEQISSLQLISSRLTIEGKHFTSLDLRFDRPVLVPK